MAAGGKVYGSRASQGRLSASTAHAWGSGTGEKNCGSLLLNLVAKKIHLRLMPPGAYSLEHLWMKGPFRLNGLAKPGCDDVQPAGDVMCSESYLFPGAPGRHSPQ